MWGWDFSTSWVNMIMSKAWRRSSLKRTSPAAHVKSANKLELPIVRRPSWQPPLPSSSYTLTFLVQLPMRAWKEISMLCYCWWFFSLYLGVLFEGQDTGLQEVQASHCKSPKWMEGKPGQSEWQWLRVLELQGGSISGQACNQARILKSICSTAEWSSGEEEQNLERDGKDTT